MQSDIHSTCIWLSVKMESYFKSSLVVGDVWLLCVGEGGAAASSYGQIIPYQCHLIFSVPPIKLYDDQVTDLASDSESCELVYFSSSLIMVLQWCSFLYRRTFFLYAQVIQVNYGCSLWDRISLIPVRRQIIQDHLFHQTCFQLLLLLLSPDVWACVDKLALH